MDWAKVVLEAHSHQRLSRIFLHAVFDADEHVTNISESRQSTSRTGAECNENCFNTAPVEVSQTIALLSYEPLRIKLPALFHFNENTGPVCFCSVTLRFP